MLWFAYRAFSISLFQEVHLRRKYDPFILTTLLPTENQLSKIPVSSLQQLTAHYPGGKGRLQHLNGYFDTNLQLYPKLDTWSHFCRWQHVKMAHCRQGISRPPRAGITVDLTHPGPINLESLGLKHCWLLQATQRNQEAKRSGSFCLRSYAWVVAFKPESNAGSQVPWCLTPEHTRVPT